MKQVIIVIPAYNEEKRIGRTLLAYNDYFNHLENNRLGHNLDVKFLVVLNGCRDNSAAIVQEIASTCHSIQMITSSEAGKGLAITIGFRTALALYPNASYIGFVDADMATQPKYFHDLIRCLEVSDGAIASRYMPGAQIFPQRPWIKRLGSLIVYDSLVKILFGIYNFDVQCGAKVFTTKVIATISPYLHVRQWSFDVELLYLCKYFGFHVTEVPTTWYDQVDSKLSILRDGLRMPLSLIQLRIHYIRFLVTKRSTNPAKRQ